MNFFLNFCHLIVDWYEAIYFLATVRDRWTISMQCLFPQGLFRVWQFCGVAGSSPEEEVVGLCNSDITLCTWTQKKTISHKLTLWKEWLSSDRSFFLNITNPAKFKPFSPIKCGKSRTVARLYHLISIQVSQALNRRFAGTLSGPWRWGYAYFTYVPSHLCCYLRSTTGERMNRYFDMWYCESNLIMCVSVGDDNFGRKVIVFNACRMPPHHQLDHHKLLM